MTNTLTPEQIAQGWIAYTSNGEPPFKKEVNGPPFQLGRMHDGELCTTAVITEKLPDEIDWSNVAAYRVWVPSLPSPPVSRESVDVDALAQEIRRVDGNHSLGALAEALMPFLSATNEPVGVSQADAAEIIRVMTDHAESCDDFECEEEGQLARDIVARLSAAIGERG